MIYQKKTAGLWCILLVYNIFYYTENLQSTSYICSRTNLLKIFQKKDMIRAETDKE